MAVCVRHTRLVSLYYGVRSLSSLTLPANTTQSPLRVHCPCEQEFGNAGMSRSLIAVYTTGIFINALTPMLLGFMLAREHTPKGMARRVRGALLADAFFDSLFGALPIVYLIALFAHYFYIQSDMVCRQATHLGGVSCGKLKTYLLMQEASECALGGRSSWAIFIKFKSRIFPLIMGPRRILTAYSLRHWVAARRRRILTVAHTVVARFQHQIGQESMRDAFDMLRQNGAVIPDESKVRMDSLARSLHVARKNNVTRRAISHLKRRRGLRYFYVPVPFWALIILVVPAVVCCVFIWVRLASVGRCDAADVVGGEAPCMVQTLVISGTAAVVVAGIRVSSLS